jgi:hypothetical protein
MYPYDAFDMFAKVLSLATFGREYNKKLASLAFYLQNLLFL